MRLIKNISTLPVNNIKSDGNVLHTLEASLWCLLNYNTYAETVLAAVNLGEDTDTTAAVAGGLAGIYYGIDAIPAEWIERIVRKDDIINLGERLSFSLEG